jgi:hypothetical protein
MVLLLYQWLTIVMKRLFSCLICSGVITVRSYDRVLQDELLSVFLALFRIHIFFTMFAFCRTLILILSLMIVYYRINCFLLFFGTLKSLFRFTFYDS